MKGITSPKDLWAGLIYVAIGVAALWFGAEYRTGSAGRMGPGYFPKALAGILLVIGVIAVVRAFIAKGTPIGSIAWKPAVIILGSCALFGWALPRLGLGVALLFLCLGSATASRDFRLEPLPVLGLIALIAFCSLVFVKGLGVPMPLVGYWFDPLLGDRLQWLR